MKFALLSVALAGCSIGNAQTFDEISSRAADALDSRPGEAITLYRQALALRPEWAEGWLYLGASLYQLNRYGEARDAFRSGIPLAPRNGTAWGFLGLCEHELGDAAHALADIRKGEELGLGPNQQFVSTVRVRAALLLIASSAFGEAMEQLQPLARAGDNSAPVIEAAGLGALGINSISNEKRNLVTLAGQAAWAFAAQRPSDAEIAYRQLITKYPGDTGVHYAYGVFLLERDPDGALAEFEKELQFSPSHVFARLQIAFLQTKRGAPELAIGPAQEAVKLDPANFQCHAALGRALLARGMIDKAIPELELAVKLAPANPQTHFLLEQAYRRAGRADDARKEKAEFTRLKADQDPLSLPGSAK